MSSTAASELYSNASAFDNETASTNYGVLLESDPDKIEVYRRYLKNLNESASLIIRNYAKMYYNDNTTAFVHNLTRHQLSRQDDVSPKPINNKFYVANSQLILIMLTVIYVIIFVTGVLGNVVTCIVIAKNRSMHTAVNYYLFSLAVSDLLLLISGKFQPKFT